MGKQYTYSQKARVFRKSYDDIHLTVVLELPRGNLKEDGRDMAVNILKDEIYNLMNDSQMEKMLRPK